MEEEQYLYNDLHRIDGRIPAADVSQFMCDNSLSVLRCGNLLKIGRQVNATPQKPPDKGLAHAVDKINIRRIANPKLTGQRSDLCG